MRFKGLSIKRKLHLHSNTNNNNNNPKKVESAEVSSLKDPASPCKKEKREKDASLYDTMRRPKRNPYSRAFEIKTNRRPNMNAEKMHVEKKIKKSGNEEITTIIESPFLQVNHLRLDRARMETASIASIEKISNTDNPLRTNKEFSKCPSPTLSAKSETLFVVSPFSCADSPFGNHQSFFKNNNDFGERAATSMGFAEDHSYNDIISSGEDDGETSDHTSSGTETETSSLKATIRPTKLIDSYIPTADQSFETHEDTSFDDGYHTLHSIDDTDPWRNYETDVLNATNQSIFSTTHTDEAPDVINMENNNQKRTMTSKRRPKSARYSIQQPLISSSSYLSQMRINEDQQMDTSFPIGNKFVSEIALSRCPSKKTADRRRRSKEINRSMTLYWDDQIEAPTSPENLVFNVSMNAKIQTYYKDTIVHTAASNGNIDIVRFYVESGQYLNAQNGFRNTPLHCAIMGSHKEIIDILLSKDDVDLSLQNIDGDTALHLSARANMDKLSEKLLSMDAENLNMQNKDGDTVMHIAIRQNAVSIIESMLERNVMLKLQNNRGDTAVHISETLDHGLKRKLLHAVLSDNLQLPIGQQKHNHMSKINQLDSSNKEHVAIDDQSVSSSGECFVNAQNNRGETLLHVFSGQGEIELVEMLLTNPCTKTKSKNIRNETALHVATRQSNFELIKVLIREDLELLNMGDGNDDTILYYVIQDANVELTKELLCLGSDLNRQNSAGNTPLHCAAIEKNADILNLLLHKNADLAIKNHRGDYPMHAILRSDDQKIFDVISEYFARHMHPTVHKLQPRTADDDVSDTITAAIMDMRDADGNNPFQACVIEGKMNFFRMLIDNCTPPSPLWASKNNKGNTALHLIAEYNRSSFLKFVNIGDIDTNVLNAEGLSAWHIALRNEHSDVAMFLLQNKWNLKMDI